MSKKEITTVSDLQGDEWALILNSQEVLEILESCGIPAKVAETYQTLLVEVGEAEYLTVYGVEYTVPHLSMDAYLLWESVNGLGQVCWDNI